jgi:hypothetical protein
LCHNHHSAALKDPALFEALTVPSKLVRRDIVRKDVTEPGTCTVIESGVPCTLPGTHRGVCERHDGIIRNVPRLRIGDFQVVEKVEITLKPPEMRSDGLCRVVVNGIPCCELQHSRGLCRPHYRQAGRLGLLESVALPSGTGTKKQSRRLPHAYFDKNVVFDWCEMKAFSTTGQQASVDLVNRVRANCLWATISATAITSAYNHVRYRARRQIEEGLLAGDEDTAERLARSTVESMLVGPWRILTLDAVRIRTLLAAPTTGLSWEDAMEWAGYQEARLTRSPPTWFVTRDSDFPEKTLPWELEQHLRG